MNVGELFYRLVHRDIPPPPMPPPGVPTDAEIRWAKQQAAQLVRRAEELGIEVDLEEAVR